MHIYSPKTKHSKLIEVIEVTAPTSSVDILHLLTPKYPHYRFILDGLVPSSNAVDFRAFLSTDNGVSWVTSGYAWWSEGGVSGSPSGYGETSSNRITLLPTVSSLLVGNSATRGLSGKIDLFGSQKNNRRTRLVHQEQYFTGVSTYAAGSGGGVYDSTTIVDAIRLAFGGGNVVGGTIAVEGVPG
jgi:hypothetical protein